MRLNLLGKKLTSSWYLSEAHRALTQSWLFVGGIRRVEGRRIMRGLSSRDGCQGTDPRASIIITHWWRYEWLCFLFCFCHFLSSEWTSASCPVGFVTRSAERCEFIQKCILFLLEALNLFSTRPDSFSIWKTSWMEYITHWAYIGGALIIIIPLRARWMTWASQYLFTPGSWEEPAVAGVWPAERVLRPVGPDPADGVGAAARPDQARTKQEGGCCRWWEHERVN